MNSVIDSMEAAEIVRQVRLRSGLSQRALAEAAGTSGPTIADYEAGKKEPRLSTIQRLIEAGGFKLLVQIAPDRHERAIARQRQIRMGMAAATAIRVKERWPEAKVLAMQQLAAMEEHVRGASATRLLRLWHRSLEQGPGFAAELLMRVGEEGDDLRQLSPFVGLFSDEERRLLLAAVAAAIA